MVAINALDHFATKRYIRGLVQGGEFDELDFLRQTSRIPPGELTRVLGALAEELQQELTVLVNEEFESFVKLFDDIGKVGQEEFHDFEDKVQYLNEAAKALSDNSKKELVILQASMQKLQTNFEEHKRLEMSLLLSKDLGRLEGLLSGKVVSSDPRILNTTTILPEPIDLEIATELVLKIRWTLNAASGKIALDEDVLENHAKLSERYFVVLEDALLLAIRKNDFQGWATLANIYLKIGKQQAISDVFINEHLRPRLKKITGRNRFGELKQSQPDKVIDVLFDDLFKLIVECRKEWFHQLQKSHPTQHLFVDCVLQAVFSTILADLNVIFSPALPDVFYKSFTLSSKFVEQIVNILSPHELISFSQMECFQAYARSWQLNSRFRDVAQAVEDSLQSLQPVDPLTKKHKILDVLDKLCIELDSGRLVLKPLKARFFRLRLQTFARVSQWFLDQVPEEITSEESMEMACTTARNHTELLLKITDMFSNSVELCQDLNKTQTEAIMSRFKTEIITRQERILSKLISLTEKWITDRVSSLQLDTKKAINLAGSYSMMKSTLSNLSIADEFFMTTCSNLITSFLKRSEELIAQSKKAVANYRRLKSIMKEETEVSHGDKEAQQEALFNVLTEEAKELHQIAPMEGELAKRLIGLQQVLRVDRL